MRLMQPVVPLWVCGHKCWQSSQDRLCMPWIMYVKDLICYCICIVNTSMQSSSYLSSSYLGLVSYYLYAVLVSWATLSMRRRVWSNPSSYHAQHAKTCINWPAVAFSVLLGACNFCHLCGISMVGSTWLHMLVCWYHFVCYSTTVCAIAWWEFDQTLSCIGNLTEENISTVLLCCTNTTGYILWNEHCYYSTCVHFVSYSP